MDTFRKTGTPSALRVEAAGLRWLAQAQDAGGARVVDVVAEGEGWLETERVREGGADPAAAEDLGRALARTHAAGAASFGCAPDGWHGDGWMGEAPLPLHEPDEEDAGTWGRFYAADRILPYLPDARDAGAVDEGGATVIERCARRVADGVFDAPQPALVPGPVARLHGDLWSGNVLWSARGGAVLIDPAAHGGHAESDLAQLGVFGAPHRDRIVAAYDETSPLSDGWEERVALHQLHILIVHAALFGGGYGSQTVAAARHYA